MKETILLGIRLIDWAWLFGGLITLGGLIKGLIEFTQNNRIKRAEFLEKLILEFNDPRMFLAKRILDDFWIDMEAETATPDIDVIKKGSMEKKEKAELIELVNDLLRNHAKKSVIIDAQHRTRQSFDDLLDFFAKLDYYLSLRLISKKELGYFRYYFKKCAFKANGAVLNYAYVYGYPSLFRLIYVLKIESREGDFLKPYLKFDDDDQQAFYYDLRNDNPVF